ncbi:MAG: Wzz/FepE/Etk N-terminal domain-containing protein [Balneolaceae bacterium]|nr:Wzz/FepE/Etk N-terminal domain-containing protein [Balneolaceae bacterium]
MSEERHRQSPTCSKGEGSQNPPPQGCYGPAHEYGYRSIEEDEIDFIELAHTFWKDRELIAKITGAFLVLGLLISLLAPKEYSTSATLMPETQSQQGGTSGLLQQYGGMLGISSDQILAAGKMVPSLLKSTRILCRACPI